MAERIWQLQDAKKHFSDVVDLAMRGEAQTVTKHGKPAVVIVSVEEYERARNPPKSLIRALMEYPVELEEFIGPRSKEPARTLHFDE
jgi:prevent-host-death family protein